MRAFELIKRSKSKGFVPFLAYVPCGINRHNRRGKASAYISRIVVVASCGRFGHCVYLHRMEGDEKSSLFSPIPFPLSILRRSQHEESNHTPPFFLSFFLSFSRFPSFPHRPALGKRPEECKRDNQ